MRTSTEIHKANGVPNLPQAKGNWMHLTIAPLVAERLESEEPLPGVARPGDELRSFVGAAGGAGLANDDLAEPRK
jgi:hypothetical protein